MTKITAPFTPEQVQGLDLWQSAAGFHPSTCANRADHPVMDGDKGVLIPTVRGWVCQFCDYTQDWAHDFMCREWLIAPSATAQE